MLVLNKYLYIYNNVEIATFVMIMRVFCLPVIP